MIDEKLYYLVLMGTKDWDIALTGKYLARIYITGYSENQLPMSRFKLPVNFGGQQHKKIKSLSTVGFFPYSRYLYQMKAIGVYIT